MTTTTQKPASLTSSFLAWRAKQKTVQLGALALVSLSTLRAHAANDAQDASRFIGETAKQRATDCSIEDEETRGAVSQLVTENEEAKPATFAPYLLTASERAQLCAVRPQARSLVLRSSPVAALEEALPADFAPVAVADYVPALVRDSGIETRAQYYATQHLARRDKWDAACVNAVSFTSDFTSSPCDFTPARVSVPAPVAVRAQTEADALLAAILKGAPLRKRCAVRV